MFRAKNNIGKVVAATLAIVATYPALTQAAEDTAAPDSTAADAATPSADSSAGGSGNSSADSTSEIVITAQRLNEARAGIQTQTGASTYTIDQAAIEATPGGDNTLFNQVILQAPGVVQDSFGQLHVRGEHNGLQYRLNGIILPEGINVFSQAFDRASHPVGVADHRGAACGIRTANRRHHRRHDQERYLRSARLGIAVRRQSR